MGACFFDDETESTAISAIALGALAGPTSLLDRVMDASSAEAMAMRNGLALVECLGCSKDTIESDCLDHTILQRRNKDMEFLLSNPRKVFLDCSWN